MTNYHEHAATMEPVATALEKVAYRLRQGAISNETAITLLKAVIANLEVMNER